MVNNTYVHNNIFAFRITKTHLINYSWIYLFYFNYLKIKYENITEKLRTEEKHAYIFNTKKLFKVTCSNQLFSCKKSLVLSNVGLTQMCLFVFVTVSLLISLNAVSHTL